LVFYHDTTRCHNPEELDFKHRRENLKTRIKWFVFINLIIDANVIGSIEMLMPLKLAN